jgi:hypothetical protein
VSFSIMAGLLSGESTETIGPRLQAALDFASPACQLAVAIRSPIAAQGDQHRGVEVIGKSLRHCFLVGECEISQHPLP